MFKVGFLALAVALSPLVRAQVGAWGQVSFVFVEPWSQLTRESAVWWHWLDWRHDVRLRLCLCIFERLVLAVHPWCNCFCLGELELEQGDHFVCLVNEFGSRGCGNRIRWDFRTEVHTQWPRIYCCGVRLLPTTI